MTTTTGRAAALDKIIKSSSMTNRSGHRMTARSAAYNQYTLCTRGRMERWPDCQSLKSLRRNHSYFSSSASRPRCLKARLPRVRSVRKHLALVLDPLFDLCGGVGEVGRQQVAFSCQEHKRVLVGVYVHSRRLVGAPRLGTRKPSA